VDNYVFPNDGYYKFDVVEVFIDEDVSGGDHTLDQNAFAYHINVNAPAEGETETSFYACDLASDWEKMNYADHIPELSMRKMGDKYYYEFSMAVYNDSYEHATPETSRVTLVGNKEMGLSLAYCDNDTPGTDRDNFFGSVWVPEEAYNDHWQYADGFGRIRLIKGNVSGNSSVELTGTITDFQVDELNTDLVVEDKLLEVFNDPDGDILSYSALCEESNLNFTFEGNVLKVNASAAFEGKADVTVTATDGYTEVSTTFEVSTSLVGIQGNATSGQISCYPNPVDNLLNIKLQLESAYTGNASVHLYNMAGMSVYSHYAIPLSGGEGSFNLDLSGKIAGYYILRVRAGGETYSMPINKR